MVTLPAEVDYLVAERVGQELAAAFAPGVTFPVYGNPAPSRGSGASTEQTSVMTHADC